MPSELEKLAEQKIEKEFYGTVYKIVFTEKVKRIYLKDIRILDDNCSKEGIIKVAGKILLYDSSEKEIKFGNVILVKTELQNFRKATNLGQYDEYWYQKNHGMNVMAYSEQIEILDNKSNWFSCILQSFREKLITVYDKILKEKEASIMKAMVLGDKVDLKKEIKNLYSENGIAHILAISGLHISMLGMIFYKILRKIVLKWKWEWIVPMKISVNIYGFLAVLIPSIASTLFVILYGQMTGFGVSTGRAILMFLLALSAGMVGRTYDLLSAVCLASLIILWQEPLYISDSGFLLSFGAILAIAVFMPILEQIFPEISSKEKGKIKIQKKIYYYFLRKIRSGFLASTAIFFVTLPIVIRIYFSYPLYGIILNLIVVPLMSLLFPMAFLMGIIGIISIKSVYILAVLVTNILKFYEWSCLITEKLPGAMQLTGCPPFWKVIIYYLVLAGMIFLWEKKRVEKNLYLYRKAILLVGLSLVGFMYHYPSSELKVHFLDIGQGDSIVMELPGGGAVTVDGGSSSVSNAGEYRLRPFLRAERIREIECAFLTHMDKDHISAVQELLEMQSKNGKEIFIKNLAVPKLIEENETWKKIKEQAQEKGTNILYVQAGDEFEIKNVRFQCLHPEVDFIDSSENAASLVMKVCYGEFTLLLTGDVEGKGESFLVENYQKDLKEVDVLKVAHHGSKNSTLEEFLETCCPNISIISCGKENRYGHPHQELLERLRNVGSKIITTKDSGEITIRTDGERTKVEEYVLSEFQ